MPITILDYVKSVTGEKDTYTGQDFASAGVAMLGGCEHCQATLGPYNAYPSRSGNWRCANCIGDTGFASLLEFAAARYAEADASPGADEAWLSCPACGSPDDLREIHDRVFECGNCGATWTL